MNTLGLRLIADIMGWGDDGTATQEYAWLRLMASAKYDGYSDFRAGSRFVENLATWLKQFYGAALNGGRGLVHVDGHSDYFHPGNYDTSAHLGSVAGMDLALATGKGEPLLADWPKVGTLVPEADAVQIGEREAGTPAFRAAYGDIVQSAITRYTVQSVLRIGVAAVAETVVTKLAARGLRRVWLHVDLDVLDQAVLPAVDSPGTPGFDHEQLALLLGRLMASGRFCGVDFTIYDPDRDPEQRYASGLVDCIARSMAPLGAVA